MTVNEILLATPRNTEVILWAENAERIWQEQASVHDFREVVRIEATDADILEITVKEA